MGRAVLWGLSFALHGYLALRLVAPLLRGWPLAAAALAALLLTSAIAVPWVLGGRPRPSSRRRRAAGWLGWTALGLVSVLLVLAVLRDLALAAVALVAAARPLPPMPWLGSQSAWAVWGLAAMVMVRGTWNARRTAAVRRVDVPITGLPPALAGFTIAQISDLHVGPTIRGDRVQAVVDRVNALDADMVAVTGDLVDGSVAELAPQVAPLAGLRARHGSFFVTGNHEYYSGAAGWIREVQRLGMQVLLNAHVAIAHAGHTVVIAGVTDFGAHHGDPAQRSDPAAAVAGARGDVTVLLAHQPRSALAAVGLGIDLQLSGHTHGGQFWPWNLFVPLQQPYTAGLHRLQGMWVYTSRGTGYWGPPLRFGAPSEITLLRLVTQ